MYRKKSMRIFWLSLCLLLVSGVAIITVVQINSHKKAAKKQQEVVSDENTGVDAGEDVQSVDVETEAKRSAAESSSQASAERQVQPVGGKLPDYSYELKAVNGYLEVYYYHTSQLFFHTGISERVLTEEQRQELNEGKYFKNEQELYGYLESCTS